LDEFINGFIKLGDQMYELNYKGTKIEIEIKLGNKSVILPKKWSLYREPLRRWHVALTHDSQHLRLMVNIQIGLLEPILQGFIKLEDQICELNYRGTKCKIENKLGDQKYNFTLYLFHSYINNTINNNSVHITFIFNLIL